MTMQVVASIHSRNLLHNDFSGGNLLFDEHLNPVCIDFGLAKIFEHREENGLELLCFGKTGTTYYASHEALHSKDRSGRFQGYTSTKGDVYAATAVLLDLIFFRDLSSTMRFVQSASRPVPWESRLSQFLNHQFGTSTGARFYQTLQPFDLGLWLDRPSSDLERNHYINAITLPQDRCVPARSDRADFIDLRKSSWARTLRSAESCCLRWRRLAQALTKLIG